MNLLDSIKYYNAHIVPTKPAHLPYRRQLVPTKYWDIMPPILHYLWILNVRAMQAGRGNVDPLYNKDLVQYRGRSLSQLQHLLKDVPGVVKDPFGVGLYSILFMMGSEMQMPGSTWNAHLEAARRIVSLKGGLVKCFEQFPRSTHTPLISFMMTDVVTASTCPSRLLGSVFMDTQRQIIEVLPDIEQEMIASGYSFPLPLLLDLVRTNILRAEPSLDHANSTSSDDFDVDFYGTFESMQSFDPERWASRAATFGRQRPETAQKTVSASSIICLASLARCYQSAAILYLILSTSDQPLEDLQLRQTVHAARYTLVQHLRLLYKQGHNGVDHGCDGPLHTQLWKLVTWPIFISIYARAGWGHLCSSKDRPLDAIAAMNSQDDMDEDIQHMRAIAAAIGSRKFLPVEKLANRVQQSRTDRLEKGITSAWRWDDAFSERTVFVV